MKPSHFRAPVHLALLVALVCKAMLLSEEASQRSEAKRWKAFGTLLLVGFFGLLRPGELMNLKTEDAVPPNSLSLASDCAVVRVMRPKNARPMGIAQYVEI